MKTRSMMMAVATVCVMAGLLNARAQSPQPAAAKPAQEEARVGVGSLTLNGLLQFWYQFADGETPDDTFRLRRSEVKLSGAVTPSVPWAVMIDPAQVREDDTKTVSVTGSNVISSVGRKSPLQDFLVTLKLHPSSSIDIGQYKVPFGMEGLESSAKLDLIERSTMASQLKWADYRDIGLTYKGDFKVGGAKILPAVGLYNGEGQNKLDVNDAVAYAARLVVKPIEALHLGVARYSGKTGSAEADNERTGGEIKIAVNPVTVYGEYMTGESGGKDKDAFYGTVTCDLGGSCQAVARYDSYDPDSDKSDDAKTETSVGLNYFVKKHNAKFALNYVFRGEEGDSVDNDVVRALAQVSF